MRHSPARHRVALGLALLGAALSAVTLVVHQRLAGDGDYTSFCNLGPVVNCDAVLGSRYAVLLGVPVAALGLAAFLAGTLLALPGIRREGDGGLADLLLIGLASASIGFSGVLAVAMASLGKLCLLCLSMDLTTLAWFASVLPLASRPATGGEVGWWRGRSAARAMMAGALVVAIAGGTWAATRAPASAQTVDDVRARAPRFFAWYTQRPIVPTGELAGPDCHRKGATDATVAIVEFSDFQCPYCVQAFRDLHELVRSRPDVSIVFRHFPLDASCNTQVQHTIHPDACLAACAAECAGQQGRFWEYHDVLFENHEHLERESLFRYAREMQLDLAAFRTCLDDPKTRERIAQDVAAASKVGVTSTPTIFFNGRAIEGALDRPYYDYALIIEEQAAHAHRGEDAG
jgi:predicted DsbA family dithiol-disulfide isomerase/uncharacterized membrane protein